MDFYCLNCQKHTADAVTGLVFVSEEEQRRDDNVGLTTVRCSHCGVAWWAKRVGAGYWQERGLEAVRPIHSGIEEAK